MTIIEAWKNAWREKSFRIDAVVSGAGLVVVLSLFRVFLEFVEQRDGIVIPDPLLGLFPPTDLTWLTFGLIYGALSIALVSLLPAPHALVLALRAYSFMVIIRTACMYVAPLDPPPTAIPLVDPLVQMFGSGMVLTRDLFFSGHTATMVILSLTAVRRPLRVMMGFAAVGVAVCVVLQHVHFSIDVVAAPFFAVGAVRLAEWSMTARVRIGR